MQLLRPYTHDMLRYAAPQGNNFKLCSSRASILEEMYLLLEDYAGSGLLNAGHVAASDGVCDLLGPTSEIRHVNQACRLGSSSMGDTQLVPLAAAPPPPPPPPPPTPGAHLIKQWIDWTSDLSRH